MTIIKDGVRPLKNFTVTPTFKETRLSSPVVLPTSMPATPQVSFTIGQSDLVSVVPSPVSMYNLPVFTLSGQNTGTTSITFNIQVNKNGVNIWSSTKTGVTSAYYWSVNFSKTISTNYCVAGDVFDIYMWTDTANSVNYNYYSLGMIPSRLILSSIKKGIKDVNFTMQNIPITLASSGAVGMHSNWSGSWYVVMYNVNNSTNSPSLTFSSDLSIKYYEQDDYFGIGYPQLGEQAFTSQIDTSNINNPIFYNTKIPSTISFREIEV